MDIQCCACRVVIRVSMFAESDRCSHCGVWLRIRWDTDGETAWSWTERLVPDSARHTIGTVEDVS